MGLLMLSGNCIEGISKAELCFDLKCCSVCVQTDNVLALWWKQVYQLLMVFGLFHMMSKGFLYKQ